MENGKMDVMLKAYFSKQRDIPEKGASCPSPEILESYVSKSLDASKKNEIENHLKTCSFCNDTIEEALFYISHSKDIKYENVSKRVKDTAKSLNPKYKIKENKMMRHLKHNIWLMLSLTSLASSFFIPRYFAQFLILALILGLKWVFNRESTRTLIMIYNAWKRRDKDSGHEIEQIFKERF